MVAWSEGHGFHLLYPSLQFGGEELSQCYQLVIGVGLEGMGGHLIDVADVLNYFMNFSF